MSVRPRHARVFAALFISMTAGAVLLMVLGSNPPSAGAFCLSRYNHLYPIEKAVSSQATQYPNHWSCIEIYYSDTKSGNIEQLTSLSELSSHEDINCHFVISNGFGGGDGQIQSTEKWQRQSPIIPDQTWCGKRTIRICVIADGKTTYPTDFQIKRVEALVDLLCRKFEILPKSVYYPSGW